MNKEISFSNAHPNAQKLMQDDFFYDVTDQIAPFGDDDSWETFMAFTEWLPPNKTRSKLDFIQEQISYWGYPLFDLYTLDFNIINAYLKEDFMNDRYLYGIDEVIIATAFGQLYLEGRIDLNLRNLATIAVKRRLLPEILLQYNNNKFSIESKYKKLLSVLSPEY